MADSFQGYVRRIDFESKTDYLESRTYAHVFLKSPDGQDQVDVYTDNPRFEAAFLTAFSSRLAQPNPTRYLEVQYETVNKTNKVVRVILDEEFTALKIDKPTYSSKKQTPARGRSRKRS